MGYNADTRWWQNRANRYAEQVENLQAEVAHQTAVVDRVQELCDQWARNGFVTTAEHVDAVALVFEDMNGQLAEALDGPNDGEVPDA